MRRSILYKTIAAFSLTIISITIIHKKENINIGSYISNKEEIKDIVNTDNTSRILRLYISYTDIINSKTIYIWIYYIISYIYIDTTKKKNEHIRDLIGELDGSLLNRENTESRYFINH